MRADTISLSKAVGLKRNPKDHDIGEINGSMNRFGYLERIVINEVTGHILAGHGRIETLRKMKVRGTAPPINIELNGTEWLVPCDYVQVPEEEEEAVAIALNRLVERGGWDDNMLVQVLSDLAAIGPEKLDGIGFDTDDLDEMMRDAGMLAGKGSDDYNDDDANADKPDLAKEMQEKYGVEEGDIWEVGNHIVACGSCRDSEFFLDVIGSLPINVVVTSPPYAKQRNKDYGGIEESDYVEWWKNVQANIKLVLSPDGSFFLNLKANVRDGQRSLYVTDLVASMVRDHDWMWIDEFCWSRLGNPGDWPNRFKNGFEPVYQFSLQRDIKFRPDAVGTGQGGVSTGGDNQSTGNYYNMSNKTIEWESARPSNLLPTFGNAIGWGHAAAFPVGLPEFFILAFSDEGDAVLDPFAGSGTTGVAAHINGRQAILIEKLPEYTAIILERMKDATGEEPVKM